VSCETGCEVSCETGCEVSCETGCEVSCETAAETPPTDTMLCGFKILDMETDPYEEVVDTIYVGHQYVCECYLYEKDPLGCDALSPIGIGSKVVKFYRTPLAPGSVSIEVASDDDGTSSDGYASATYIPTEDHVGEYSFDAWFWGDDDYEKSGTYLLQTITIKKEAPPTCDQPFRVEDQNGDPVVGAEVSATDPVLGTVYGPETTDANGECDVTIDEGVWVYGFVSALPDGYEGTPATGMFTACESEKTLVVTEIVGIIESYSAPKELEEGEELTVSFVAKNIGPAHGILGGFKMHLWIDGTKYDTEPDTYWKSLDHGETWEDEVNTIGSIPLWSMPNNNVDVKIVLEDKYEGDQATEEFVVALKGHPEIGIIESIECAAEEDLITGGWEITAAVVVKNTDTVKHQYYIAMYDAKTGKHLGDEPDIIQPWVGPGKTTTIDIDTKKWPVDSTTPEVRFDLYKCDGFNKLIGSETKDCKAEPAIPIPWTAILYGGIAIVIGTLGSILPGKIGKIVPVLAIVPGGLCIYTLYKEYADKIPFVSTIPEQLALPAELREPLQRKKKVLL